MLVRLRSLAITYRGKTIRMRVARLQQGVRQATRLQVRFFPFVPLLRPDLTTIAPHCSLVLFLDGTKHCIHPDQHPTSAKVVGKPSAD